MSKDSYLNIFFDINKEEIDEKLVIIYKDEPYYKFPKEYMYLRQYYIRKKLDENQINWEI